MKNFMKRFAGVLTVTVLSAGLTGCSGNHDGSSAIKSNGEHAELAQDYYIDLTELGMKLTFFLRVDEEGKFIFSNTLDFETDKSSGTVQKSEDSYMMVYSSVNGEEKSISDGITSSFEVLEDGTLDFTDSVIHYGSATANTNSAEDPDSKLLAVIVPEDYEAPVTESEFQIGTYVADDVSQDGAMYSHLVSFYEDNTYVHITICESEEDVTYDYEAGTYGISTTQLAMEPEGAAVGHEGRVENEVIDESHLNLTIIPYAGATERKTLKFSKTEEVSIAAELTGIAEGKEGETFDVSMKIYEDGTYETAAEGFVEKGILLLDTEDGYVKQYPDHPETGTRGLKQVATVPAGIFVDEDEIFKLEGLRIRKSAGLTRYEAVFE